MDLGHKISTVTVTIKAPLSPLFKIREDIFLEDILLPVGSRLLMVLGPRILMLSYSLSIRSLKPLYKHNTKVMQYGTGTIGVATLDTLI